MRKRTQRGFNLIELMVVVLLIGLSLLLSIPAFGRFQRSWRLMGEVDRVASTMRTARSVAITKNIDAVFEFDTSTHTYFYFEDEDGNGSRAASEYQSATYELSEGVTFSGHTLSGTKIIFGPKGNANDSGTITVSNTQPRSLTISLFGGTGNVRVD